MDNPLRKWTGDIATELRRLARTKKMKPALASVYPILAQLLGIDDPEEDIRPPLKDLLEEVVEEREEEEEEEEEEPLGQPLLEPSMALLGLTPRTEHKGIGARQKAAAQLRGIEPTSMRKHEIKMAEELGFMIAAIAMEIDVSDQ